MRKHLIQVLNKNKNLQLIVVTVMQWSGSSGGARNSEWGAKKKKSPNKEQTT